MYLITSRMSKHGTLTNFGSLKPRSIQKHKPPGQFLATRDSTETRILKITALYAENMQMQRMWSTGLEFDVEFSKLADSDARHVCRVKLKADNLRDEVIGTWLQNRIDVYRTARWVRVRKSASDLVRCTGRLPEVVLYIGIGESLVLHGKQSTQQELEKRLPKIICTNQAGSER